MKQRSIPVPLIVCFVIIECAIYAAFLTLDLAGRSGDTLLLKYAGILLCLLFALLSGNKLVTAALAFTAAADWFLLVRGDHLILGVALFFCVQTIYAIRLHREGAPWALWLRIGLAALAIFMLVLLNMVTSLNLLALVYFSQLVSNTILAWPRRSTKRFALGLTLFIGCDVCVGLFNVLPHSSEIYSLVSVGMWLFYLPSQVLIALSVLPYKEVAHENK